MGRVIGILGIVCNLGSFIINYDNVQARMAWIIAIIWAISWTISIWRIDRTD